jgi:hypothetical protein
MFPHRNSFTHPFKKIENKKFLHSYACIYTLSEWMGAGSVECKYIFDKQGAAFALQWRRMDASMLCHRKKVTSTSPSPSRVYGHSKQLTSTSQEQVQSLSLSLSNTQKHVLGIPFFLLNFFHHQDIELLVLCYVE